MNSRSQAWAAIAMAALLLAPRWAAAQAGMGAFDLEHAPKGPQGAVLAGNGVMGANASGNGVANPLGFKESTAPVIGAGVTVRIDPAIEYAKGFTDLNLGRFGAAEADFDLALRADPRNSK